MASQGIEIEKKYDVGDDATVPALEELPGVARVGTPRSAVLEAVYFDTDQHTLASAASRCAAAPGEPMPAGT
jgi:inorganic triphosphatase YgiF